MTISHQKSCYKCWKIIRRKTNAFFLFFPVTFLRRIANDLRIRKAEARAEFAERSVQKLQKEVDRLEGKFFDRYLTIFQTVKINPMSNEIQKFSIANTKIKIVSIWKEIVLKLLWIQCIITARVCTHMPISTTWQLDGANQFDPYLSTTIMRD